MQDKHLFEYAVIRVVPRVEREEFVNVGVILYCRGLGFLHTIFDLNEDRLKAFCKDLDMEELKERLQAFERICKGRSEGGPIGQLSIAERFRWLTAARSTVVQTSAVHPGLCTNAEEMLQHLHNQLVL
ncbi:DUF3037 domain-containing protein [Pontibacter cellulosilyticus]|uniref:DUF3037 domain-containing protein n=1 Tax=Pontibacter cellulosilyticus TaxID=1720253 RepID=A0A923N7J2_9BACT|nr:DUF3037 domain-containing protein [Pontibacter cellulosilyticus]MBC5994350.1 DUF3037 domain-containing protein [Pontibacter cellulosilyticus]